MIGRVNAWMDGAIMVIHRENRGGKKRERERERDGKRGRENQETSTAHATE